MGGSAEEPTLGKGGSELSGGGGAIKGKTQKEEVEAFTVKFPLASGGAGVASLGTALSPCWTWQPANAPLFWAQRSPGHWLRFFSLSSHGAAEKGLIPKERSKERRVCCG